MEKVFNGAEIEAIARALGHTQDGLTGSEIGNLLDQCGIEDANPDATKWIRINNALANRQNKSKNRRATLEFIRQSMNPARHIKNPDRFETLRNHLNMALAFSGLAVSQQGKLIASDSATTLTEAEARARALRETLASRDIHPDVLAFCSAELVADNYFHAVLEATKSVAEKIRSKTGLDVDGAALVDRAFSGERPILAINALKSENENSEQKGFAHLLKGIFGMFRNPTAHAPRVAWEMTRADAEDLLSTLSLVHRRLDNSTLPPRA